MLLKKRNRMIQFVIIILIMISLGVIIYTLKYKNKEKPKIGIRRENKSEYVKDYWNLKLYFGSIAFIIIGIVLLIAIILIEFLSD